MFLNRICWKVNLVLLFALFLYCDSAAQIIVLYSSKPAPVGAREEGLAEAYAADPSDVTSMYANPASLAFLLKQSVVVSHLLDQSINGMNENVSFPLRFGNGEQVGIGLTINHVGYLGSSDNTDFHVIQYGYDISYAKEIIPSLSVGAGVGVRYAQSDSTNLWGVSSSFGLFYMPSKEISYGISLSDVGSDILYISDRVKTNLSSENMPRVLQAAMSLRFPSSPDQTFLTLSVANEKIFGTPGILYNGGFEWYLFPYVALRWGYLYQQNLTNQATYGFGLRKSKFQLDYAIMPSNLGNRSYQISFAVSL